MKEIGLVLQGGGALGAYEFGVLERLYQEDWFEPDIVSGVSIGAVTAAVIMGPRNGDPVSSLEELWERISVISPALVPDSVERFFSLYGNPNFYRMRMDFYNMAKWTSVYDTGPLRNTLDELVDFKKLNESGRLIVTATNVETGKLETFDSSETEITIDHIMASGSLPPGFPMTEVKGRHYWDGGIFDNTPLSPVVSAFSSKKGVERTLIVINLFPSEGQIPVDMLDVFDRVLEILFSNKIDWDVDMLNKVNEFAEAVEAIDKALPRNSPVRRMEGYKRLKNYKIIENVIYITNPAEEFVFAPFDFSKKSIEDRRREGHHDAERAIQESGV